MSNPAFSAAAFTAPGSPTKMGARKLSFRSRAAASRIRGSVPSVKTMVLGAVFNFSTMEPKRKFSIFVTLLQLFVIIL